MERTISVSPHHELWADDRGDPGASTILLIMGANASGVVWPEPLVDRLAARHHVIRYDHRDTGRSSRAFHAHPYSIADLAGDAVAVLDAFGVATAHVVGMSMGGTLVQLLLLDAPERLRSATLFATSALGAGLADPSGTGELPGPDPRLLALWEQMGEPREPSDELAWRVEHWRLLNGDVLPFDADEFRALEQRVADHAGTAVADIAHAVADQGGLERGSELAGVTVPTLVIEAPQDPINPPPHAEHLEASIGTSRRVVVPGMGHALSSPVLEPLGALILEHIASVEA